MTNRKHILNRFKCFARLSLSNPKSGKVPPYFSLITARNYWHLCFFLCVPKQQKDCSHHSVHDGWGAGVATNLCHSRLLQLQDFMSDALQSPQTVEQFSSAMHFLRQLRFKTMLSDKGHGLFKLLDLAFAHCFVKTWVRHMQNKVCTHECENMKVMCVQSCKYLQIRCTHTHVPRHTPVHIPHTQMVIQI